MVIGSHNHHLPAFLLKFSNINIAEFRAPFFPLYADDRDNIEQDRKEDPADYQNLVILVPWLEAIDEAHHGAGTNPSKDDIHSFWESEAQLGLGRHRQTSTR